MVVWTCAEVANCPPARVVKGVRLVQVVALCVVVSCCNSVVSCGGLALFPAIFSTHAGVLKTTDMSVVYLGADPSTRI